LLLSADVFEERHTNMPIYVDADGVDPTGRSKVRGAELSFNGSITDDWNVTAGYSYLHARITKGGDYDNLDEQLRNTPPHTFSFWSTYRVIPQLTVAGGAYYRDEHIGYGGFGAQPEYIDPYWRFDAMGRWQIQSHFALQLNVQNIADKLYY